jgi:hypothetical protein
MEDSSHTRIAWTTRINVKPAARDAIREIARDERLSAASVLGMAVDYFLTHRSSE